MYNTVKVKTQSAKSGLQLPWWDGERLSVSVSVLVLVLVWASAGKRGGNGPALSPLLYPNRTRTDPAIPENTLKSY
jgi:hypothetical protein